MSNDRESALHHLIEYRLPLEPALATLSNCPWDAAAPVAWLRIENVTSILARYSSGNITAEQLTDWADLIECREDIGIAEHEDLVKEIIFRLANPNLNGEVTPEVVAEIQGQIRNV